MSCKTRKVRKCGYVDLRYIVLKNGRRLCVDELGKG